MFNMLTVHTFEYTFLVS